MLAGSATHARLSPAATLERGYAVARLAEDQSWRPRQTSPGERRARGVARGSLDHACRATTDATRSCYDDRRHDLRRVAARPFDELVAELQRIVQALEAGNLPLEESIARYREALLLHAAAETRLRDAELTISQLGRGLDKAADEAPDETNADDIGA